MYYSVLLLCVYDFFELLFDFCFCFPKFWSNLVLRLSFLKSTPLKVNFGALESIQNHQDLKKQIKTCLKIEVFCVAYLNAKVFCCFFFFEIKRQANFFSKEQFQSNSLHCLTSLACLANQKSNF